MCTHTQFWVERALICKGWLKVYYSYSDWYEEFQRSREGEFEKHWLRLVQDRRKTWMLLVISQFVLPGSSEGWELGCTIKMMTSAYKLVFGILGEHYLANSFFWGGKGVVLDDSTLCRLFTIKQLFVNVFCKLITNSWISCSSIRTYLFN